MGAGERGLKLRSVSILNVAGRGTHTHHRAEVRVVVVLVGIEEDIWWFLKTEVLKTDTFRTAKLA